MIFRFLFQLYRNNFSEVNVFWAVFELCFFFNNWVFFTLYLFASNKLFYMLLQTELHQNDLYII